MYKLFASMPHLTADISTVRDGNMRLNGDDTGGRENRAQFVSRFGFHPGQLVHTVPQHGTHTVIVDRDDIGTVIEADALATNNLGVVLSMTAGDCIPVFLVDPVARAIGLAHAGWRGLDRGVVRELATVMTDRLGASVGTMLAAVGPAICWRDYRVGPEVLERFAAYQRPADVEPGFLDLKGICAQQLRSLGIVPEHIETDPRCTFWDPHLYSARARDAARMLAIMALGQ